MTPGEMGWARVSGLEDQELFFSMCPKLHFPYYTLGHGGPAGSRVPGGNTVARAVRGTCETPMPAPIECFLLWGQMEGHHKQLETLLSPWRAALKCQPEQGQREASPERQAPGFPPMLPHSSILPPGLRHQNGDLGAAKGCFGRFLLSEPLLL